ncbi:MAK10-like protein [Tanacetum coccineum]|uniref:MAK10-like protein n=1 Tax=Tanacetum coccineum TaxID=301880 RepID=A0ABQ4XVW6_9ASTR
MGDENPIRTLGDYSKASHEGYRNTIKLSVGNNVVPLRSDTIRLVQNGCSFHGLRSDDPNQHRKDFLKLVDSLDLDGENRERTRLGLSPQPQALETTFEARVWDYMAAHTERMERFENVIFKQREGINSRMTEMFGLLKELTTSRTPEKVLIREEAKFPITKNVNSISLTKGEEEMRDKKEVTPDNTKRPTETEAKMQVKKAETKKEAENKAGNKSIKTPKNEEAVDAPGTRVGKKKGKTYKVLPRGPVYDVILKKKITKKEDIRGNFKIPCSIGGLKHANALIDQGSNVNVMPYSTYMKLTNERHAETDIRLSLASHSYIYPLGIAEDVLVEVSKYVYPVYFLILDIKKNEKRPFILGTPFLTTAKATIRFDKGMITIRSGKSKASPGIGSKKDNASPGKGDEVQPMEEKKF